MNLWQVMGRLGQDPEVKYTPSGAAVVNFSVATSEKWTDKASGEKKERTEWTPVVFWGKQAEVIGEYFSKGKMILVVGKAQTRNWEGEDGVKRYKTELVGREFHFCGDKGGGGGYTPKEEDYGAAPSYASSPGASNVTVEDDDIPF
jgi:single-strand DNA-binding protein